MMISRWIIMMLMLFLVNTIPFAFFTAGRIEQLPEVAELIEQQDYEQAIIELNRINGNSLIINTETDYYYSVCYNRLGMAKTASGYADHFLKRRNDHKGLYEKAVAESGMGNHDTALEIFKQVAPGFENNSEFQSYYGNAYYYTGDYEQAMVWLEQAAGSSDDGGILNYLLYDSYYKTENYDRAVAQAGKELAGLNPEDEDYRYDREELLYYRGDYYYLNRQYEEAVKDYQLLAGEDTYYKDEAYYLIARCYACLEDYENTYNYLKMGIEYDSYYYPHYQADEAFEKFFESDYYRDQRGIFEPDFESGLEAGSGVEF